MEGAEFWNQVLQQGGLLSVLLAVLFFYRRDFLNHKDTLLDVVKDNTSAMTELNETSKRMARALETRNGDDWPRRYDGVVRPPTT